MLRTNTVTLTVIKGIAYRQKLPSGGSGIVLLREDAKQPGIASISKTSGDAIPAANTPKELYPQDAFKEAIALTSGMPYKKQGSVKVKGMPEVPETASEDIVEEEAIIDSSEYQKIIDTYTDKNGKLSYSLINKDMIRFAHFSSRVRKMVADGDSEKKILLYTVGTKFRNIAGNSYLTDSQILKMIDLLDEVSPKSVLKEFRDEIRRSRKGKK